MTDQHPPHSADEIRFEEEMGIASQQQEAADTTAHQQSAEKSSDDPATEEAMRLDR